MGKSYYSHWAICQACLWDNVFERIEIEEVILEHEGKEFRLGASVPVMVCFDCGHKMLDERAQKIIDEVLDSLKK